ncbi:nucleoside hydrolase [Desertivirga xinjiangensis]|uniref:nucleoside hydrolase n=1 Tax=Desertivirga xinjiangensis TaxID=539206 RepID=UPI00210A5277|nr:nucleoside hydrolase [Pedobacter xinjiangensis]
MEILNFKSVNIICLLLALGMANAIPASAQKESHVPVIFETDMGNDVDDGLALAMLFRYADDGVINLLGISNNKQSLSSLQFIDLMRRKYGYPQLPIATVQNGVQGENEAKSFARKVMDYKEDGRLVYSSRVKNYKHVESAVHFYRRMLANAKDTSVVIISVGFSSNLAAVLESKPDRYSILNGRELIARKVKFLSTMAGNFSSSKQKEFNIISDLPASRKVFRDWPGPIYISPFEVGASIHFPATVIEANLGYKGHHPLVTAYKEYIPMPYNRETWDLSSVLFAVEPEVHYFQVSKPGKLVVDEDGYTQFNEDINGRHYFLHTPSRPEGAKIKDRYVELIRAVTP